MKISTQAIKFINQHFGSAGDPAPDGVDALVQKIGAQLAAVEEVVPFGDKYSQAVVVKVVACEDHPNADRLHICWIDDGQKVADVERAENGLVQVVCGAPNVRAGMMAVWLPPGSTVPNTFDKDPFVLEARELRGVKSSGMLASPKELDFGDNHDRILELAEDDAAPGTLFADAFHLRDDHIIDMENKMFTHRPDLFGYLGLAREIEGIQHRPYKSPEWYRMNPTIPSTETDQLPFEVANELPDQVLRFAAMVLCDVKVGPSPVWLQADLARAGLRPINNIVDYTNFFMLETGQPLHAYDYDKVKARSQGDTAKIVVRHPQSGEKLTLLNGKQVEPRQEAIMIATDKELIGIGGVMGGADTEVDETTTRIILESATFDMYSIRRTSMAHGLFTDAVTRFNKGQSPLQNLAALGKIVDEIRRFAGGKVASPLIDINLVPQEAQERGNIHVPVTVTTPFINERLGWQLSATEMSTLLTNVEFTVEITNDTLTVTAPFWRTDIEIPEDIVEEIGRLYGYDHLPLNLPKRDLTPAPKNPSLVIKQRIRELLAQAGANEVLTYSFVHGNLLDKTGQDRELAFRLSNALSPDLQYFRLGLTPSLLEKVHPNIKAGFGTFALFEIGKVHVKELLDDEGLTRELARLALVFAAEDKVVQDTFHGAPYYQARKYLIDLLAQLGLGTDIAFEPLAKADFGGHKMVEQFTKPYEPNRSAVLMRGERIVGVIGEYRSSVARALKLPKFTAGFEMFISAFADAGNSPYVQLPRFPSVTQDICLRVPAELPYQQLFDFVMAHLHQHRPDATYHTLGPVDIFQREAETDRKQITLRLSIASFDRTLTDDEVNKLLDNVASAARAELQAERV